MNERGPTEFNVNLNEGNLNSVTVCRTGNIAAISEAFERCLILFHFDM